MNKERHHRSAPAPGRNDVHVMLNYGPLGLVRAVTRDVRLDGMTVDTGVIRLTRNTDVEVTFSVRRNNRFQVHRVDASVAGAAPGGAQLLFRDYGRDTYELLKEMMQPH